MNRWVYGCRHSAATAGVILLMASLSGCATFGHSSRFSKQRGFRETISADVANAIPQQFSEDVAKASEATHSFLVGQLSLGDQEFERALESFERAEELSSARSGYLYTRIADLHLRMGNVEKALNAAEQALRYDADNMYVRMLYAGILETLQRPADAEPIYQQLMEESPQDMESYLLLANMYSKQRQFDKAIKVLTKLQKFHPKQPISRLYLGKIYEEQQEYGKAERQYQWVFDRDSYHQQGAVELIRVLLRQGKIKEAKSICETLVEHDPKNAVALKVLGHIMLGESKLDDALKYLTAVEALESDPADTRFKVALIHMEKRNFAEAIRELNLVVVSNPAHSEARYYLASMYAGSGRVQEALEELQKIDSSSSMYVKSKTFAAFLLRQEGELKESLKAVDAALEHDPKNITLILYGALLLRDLDNLEKAAARLRAALEVMPGDERLLFNLGLVLHEKDDFDSALVVMEEILTSNARNADALNYVAYALAEQGKDLARAEKLVRKALEINPHDGYYLDTLGFIQHKQGAFLEAEATLAKAFATTSDDAVIVDHYVAVLLRLKKEEVVISVLSPLFAKGSNWRNKQDDGDLVRRLADLLSDLKRKLEER